MALLLLYSEGNSAVMSVCLREIVSTFRFVVSDSRATALKSFLVNQVNDLPMQGSHSRISRTGTNTQNTQRVRGADHQGQAPSLSKADGAGPMTSKRSRRYDIADWLVDYFRDGRGVS